MGGACNRTDQRSFYLCLNKDREKTKCTLKNPSDDAGEREFKNWKRKQKRRTWQSRTKIEDANKAIPYLSSHSGRHKR